MDKCIHEKLTELDLQEETFTKCEDCGMVMAPEVAAQVLTLNQIRLPLIAYKAA